MSTLSKLFNLNWQYSSQPHLLDRYVTSFFLLCELGQVDFQVHKYGYDTTYMPLAWIYTYNKVQQSDWSLEGPSFMDPWNF